MSRREYNKADRGNLVLAEAVIKNRFSESTPSWRTLLFPRALLNEWGLTEGGILTLRPWHFERETIHGTRIDDFFIVLDENLKRAYAKEGESGVISAQLDAFGRLVPPTRKCTFGYSGYLMVGSETEGLVYASPKTPEEIREILESV